MKFIRRLLIVSLTIAFLGAFLGLGGCGSSDDDSDDFGDGVDDSGTAKVRFVNLAPDARAVDVFVDEDLFTENVLYALNDGYHSIDAGTRTIRVDVRNTFTNLVLGAFAFDSGQDYTIFVTGRVDDTEGTVFFDNNDRASDGRVKVRVVHAIDNLRDVNIYITRPEAEISSSLPSLTDLGYLDRTVYLENGPGIYRIRATLADSQVVIADSGPITLREGEVTTAMLIENLGGGTPFAIPVFIDRE